MSGGPGRCQVLFPVPRFLRSSAPSESGKDKRRVRGVRSCIRNYSLPIWRKAGAGPAHCPFAVDSDVVCLDGHRGAGPLSPRRRSFQANSIQAGIPAEALKAPALSWYC